MGGDSPFHARLSTTMRRLVSIRFGRAGRPATADPRTPQVLRVAQSLPPRFALGPSSVSGILRLYRLGSRGQRLKRSHGGNAVRFYLAPFRIGTPQSGTRGAEVLGSLAPFTLDTIATSLPVIGFPLGFPFGGPTPRRVRLLYFKFEEGLGFGTPLSAPPRTVAKAMV